MWAPSVLIRSVPVLPPIAPAMTARMIIKLLDDFDAELMHHSTVHRSPTVVLADNNPAYSYGFEAPKANNSGGGGWFAGLKAKISQLAGISEWMSQLGIGDNHPQPPQRSMSTPASAPVPRQHVDDDSISYHSISLDDCAAMPEWDDEHWDFGASFLADLDSSHVWNDTLERQHFGPLKDLVTTGGGKADGHNFISITLMHPTWCDKCGDFIWGLLKQAAKCEKCNYTCHTRCRELVTLDCRSAGSSLSSGEFPSIYPKLLDGTLGTIPKELHLPPIPMSPFSDSDKENDTTSVENPLFSPSKSVRLEPMVLLGHPLDEQVQPETVNGTQTLQISEVYVKEDTPFEWSPAYRDANLAERIDEYNKTSEGLSMKMCDDGETFCGHIQIHMNLTRPISVVAGEKPPTVYDVVNTGKSSMSSLRTITSFFLPRNTVKTININSRMTTRQMIVTLLRKFRVADNPRKFALYECSYEDDRETPTLLRKMTRISDDVCPLKVVLSWQNAKCGKALVLQENDTGDILWDAFEVPELDNFLRILKMEEQQYQWQIRQRYHQYRYFVDMELRRRGYNVGEDIGEPPTALAPPPPPLADYNEYGTGESMVVSDVFQTMRNGQLSSTLRATDGATAEAIHDPTYVNLSFLRAQQMEQSTRL
ncbi:unnamed protein product [Cylicocyclus nassatus]|uniref:Uncharacterized protein n=1 Tax=Cylicocyclus nassatus TaxID=53992 RepID=A0AA36H363_CYLNA|nr:unnamed protein product [Cylicocyclus nassatus]